MILNGLHNFNYMKCFFTFCCFYTITCFANAQTGYDECKESLTSQNIENLTAFAEIYNCVRYFYPSKAVQSIDWKKLAIYGVRETQHCTSKQELIDRLYMIFHPLCSELRIDSFPLPLQNLPVLSKKGRKKFIHYGSGKTPYLGFGVIALLYRLDKPYYTKVQSLTASDTLSWYGDKAGELFFALPEAAAMTNHPSYNALKQRVDSISINQMNVKQREFFVNANLRSHRLASIIITWGNFRHFYPYKDLIAIDWDKQLAQALQDAPTGDYVDFHFCLRKMLEPLHDGHIRVLMGCSKGIYGATLTGRSPGIALKNINDTIVLKDDFLSCPKGTRLDAVNGVPVQEWLEAKKAYVSASPQLKRLLATEELLTSYRPDTDTAFLLALTAPDGKQISVTAPVIEEDADKIDTVAFISQKNHVYIFRFRSEKATDRQLYKTLKSIAKDTAAKGIIIDFRDAKYMNHKFLGYFIDSAIYSAPFKVPIVTAPKQEQMEYKINQFKVTPRKGKITVPVLFLVDASVMSYGESVMGMVEYYKIGAIVGEPTAGINGDVASLSLPVHDIWSYTGMRVDKHNGSPLFCTGITPTHPANYTVVEYQQGIDVPLQKAMRIIKQYSYE
jgi:hypothetical protein